jgi:hypothetical protein
MGRRCEVLEMFQDEESETEMFAKGVKCIVHCFLEPNVVEGITALEAMGMTVDKESVYYVELSLSERNMLRFRRIIVAFLPFKHLKSIVLLLLSIQAIRSISTIKYWLVYFGIINYASL